MELQRRASDAGLDWLTATTLHPGVVDTDLWRYVVGEGRLAKMKDGRDGMVGSLALGATRLFAKTPEEGASTQVYLAATTDDVAKGAFYEEMKEKADLPWFATDGAKARALWDASEGLSRIRFDLTAVVATTDGAATLYLGDKEWGKLSPLDGEWKLLFTTDTAEAFIIDYYNNKTKNITKNMYRHPLHGCRRCRRRR